MFPCLMPQTTSTLNLLDLNLSMASQSGYSFLVIDCA